MQILLTNRSPVNSREKNDIVLNLREIIFWESYTIEQIEKFQFQKYFEEILH